MKHSYELTDEQVSGYITYYRLTQVDFDGTETIIGLTVLDCNTQFNNDLVVYPNPAHKQFTIEIKSVDEHGAGNLQIHDLTGKVVYSQEVSIGKGINKKPISRHNLERGTYIISVQGEKAKFKPVQLIIM